MEDSGIEESQIPLTDKQETAPSETPVVKTDHKDKVSALKTLAKDSKKFLNAAVLLGKATGSVAVGPADEIASAALSAIPPSGQVQEAALGTEKQATWRGNDLIVIQPISKTHTVGAGSPEPPGEATAQKEQKPQTYQSTQKAEKPNLPIQSNRPINAPRRS